MTFYTIVEMKKLAFYKLVSDKSTKAKTIEMKRNSNVYMSKNKNIKF